MSLTDDLNRSELFLHVDLRERDRLGQMCREAIFDPGDALIIEGERHHAFHIIGSGQMSVTKMVGTTVREVALLGPGSFVGEMAMLTGKPASATVTAVTACRVIEVPREVVDELRKSTAALGLLDEVVRRRKATNRLDRAEPISVTLTGDLQQPLLLRPMWPDDWRLMALARDDHRVSDETLRRRFFTLPKMHDAFLRRLANVDYLDQFAWAVVDQDGQSLAAVGRYALIADDPTTAEIALLVADDVQGRGLGGLLMVALASAARAHGVTHFQALAQADNAAVQRLLEHFGATWEPGDRGQEVSAVWPVADVFKGARSSDPVDELIAAAQAILG